MRKAKRLSQLWVCAEGKVAKYYGDVSSYKVSSALVSEASSSLLQSLIVDSIRAKTRP